MNEITITPEAPKQLMKEVLFETLNEKHDLMRDVMAEAPEGVALLEAIKDGKKRKK
jgi:hypothetical protein